MEKLSELVKLRVSMARLAQAAEVDNNLRVTDKNYDDLIRLAQTQERGWNHLAELVYDRLKPEEYCYECNCYETRPTCEEYAALNQGETT